MKDRTAREASQADGAFVSRDDTLGDCQTQASTPTLGCEKWMEHAILQLFWNARSGICHANFQVFMPVLIHWLDFMNRLPPSSPIACRALVIRLLNTCSRARRLPRIGGQSGLSAQIVVHIQACNARTQSL